MKNRPSPTSFYVTTEAASLDNGLIESLESTIQSHPDIKLIIIDTLQKIRSQSKLGNNVYQQDYAEIGAIKSFADKHSISMMFVHHLRKMKDGDDQFNMISGSTALMGAVDTSFVITKKSRNDINATLHITGRDIESGELIMRFNKATCQWELVGNAQDVAKQNEKSEYDNNLKALDGSKGFISIRGTVSDYQTSKVIEYLGFDETAKNVLFRKPSLHGEAGGDWLHINSISTLGENKWYNNGDERFNHNNIIFDSRNANILAILSKETGKIVWKIGPDFNEIESNLIIRASTATVDEANVAEYYI